MKIAKSVALVTGANRGIGEALVHALLESGASKIYAAARDLAQLDAGLAADPRVVALQLDVTKPEQAEAAARKATDVNLLINNAGVAHYGVTLLDDVAPANLREETEVNLFGILHMFRAFWRVVVRNDGAIANILSGAAIQHNPMLGTYSCTKAAALSMTVGMRTLLRERNTLVAAALVGSVDTRLSKDVPSYAAKASTQSVAAAILAGLERNEEDIDTDAGAIGTRARVARDPKKAERHHDIRLKGLPRN
ncbi:MAG: SDR family NAD(P)-dependent oxidoreductase [Burkholderiaceae bacterium]